jgi:hypothetical protein
VSRAVKLCGIPKLYSKATLIVADDHIMGVEGDHDAAVPAGIDPIVNSRAILNVAFEAVVGLNLDGGGDVG